MDCRDLRETISAFVDGEATPGEAARARAHLASCPGCRALEARMRALGDGVRQLRPEVPKGFRDAVFARLEAEGAIPPKRKVFAPSWRWAAVPLAAAAALGLFLLTSREVVRERTAPGPPVARVETPAPAPGVREPAGGRGSETPPDGTPVTPRNLPEAAPHAAGAPRSASGALTAEEKEMIALLDVLSDPVSFDVGEDAEALDLLDLPGNSGGGRGNPSRGRNGA